MALCEKEFKERLVKTVKKEVKQIMEEAVTRKFVHQDSSSVTSLCAAVEGCLSHGLRRRALGLFRSSSTTALMHKVAKGYPPAAIISKLILDSDSKEGVKRSSSSGDSITRMASYGGVKPVLQKRNSGSWLAKSTTPKYLWIRLALFERILAGIIEHLVENSMKYYEKDALVADPEYGSVLSHLLVGPCALEFTKLKTRDHYWTDPPADELVQRHRISSGTSGGIASVTNRRPRLQFRKLLQGGSSSDSESAGSISGRSIQVNSTAKDYVESLHQNNKTVLLYGKNNVLVLSKDLAKHIPGYLSLHHGTETLTLKWTPNQLMNGGVDYDGADKSSLWSDALHLDFYNIVYVHCHQKGIDTGGSMVLVGHDGVQFPAIHFPSGGHLLSFLTCLEAGLQPKGRLDPPLGIQSGKGKVFPRLKRQTNNTANSNLDEEEVDEPSDYVFRIIFNAINPSQDQNNYGTCEIFDEPYENNCDSANQNKEGHSPRSPSRWWATRNNRTFFSSGSSSTSSSSSSKSLSVSLSLVDNSFTNVSPLPIPIEKTVESFPVSFSGDAGNLNDNSFRGDSLQVLCETMKRQIISRAFYGWLAHCRHLQTVRTHLSGLVNHTIVKNFKTSGDGVNDVNWKDLMVNGVLKNPHELYRLCYFGGVAHHLRKEVWPYLLGHYQSGSTFEERELQDKAMQATYESTMSEWLAVEAIIRQRDKENIAASIAKLSYRSQSGELSEEVQMKPLLPNISNEVFYDGNSIDGNFYADDSRNENTMNSESFDNGCEKQNLDPKDLNEMSPNASLVMVVTHPSSGSEEAEMNATFNQNDLQAKPVPKESDLHHSPSTLEKACCNKDLTASSLNLAMDDGIEKCSVSSYSPCTSPMSSQGGVYTTEFLEQYGLNLHRIDKDVQRCDRNYSYFHAKNLEKLRNIMCTYVWCHLDTGYIQGMCDLVAPLLVIIDEEALTYSCFCELMKRMTANFPQGGAMDNHFANMRSLIQILDSEMFDLMHQNGDYTHFYFCYRWFLLDFKREFLYEDVFLIWETIWAARHIASSHFVLFVALALVQYYREIILANAMDSTDIIKFFNEMAERHDPKIILQMARDLVLQLQTLMEST